MKWTYLILNWLSVLIGSPILVTFVIFIIGSIKVDIVHGIDVAGTWVGLTIFYFIFFYFKIIPFLILYIITYLIFRKFLYSTMLAKGILMMILLVAIFINFYQFYDDKGFILISLGYYLPVIASGIFIELKDDKKFFGI
ncbi:hypothetical protein SAMN05421741_1405 [Paenimyroides ummariense]|uniref:Uncharacterized protein n=1 Tax=Paenimyroides ummariense TaxID=913024 RepID=A0A1I5GEC5_9FLAO|nr:hypothetical protein [Paenimyroides ummariense]SFO34286.1 hypothetical protein SAMN05421741_1405 [Paenimyroides ummariense]